MNTPLPLLGWVLIIFLVALIVGINLSLFVKKKPQSSEHWMSKLMSAGKEIKDPFHKDEAKLQELADRVARFKSQLHDDNGTVGDNK